jgi:hypothetical protein
MIEHRCSRREAIAVAASLYRNGNYLAAGTIRDVNQNGVFLETETAVPKNTFIEVMFTLPCHQNQADHRFFAMVAHRAESGLGLYVDVLVPESRNGMRALLGYSETHHGHV